MTSSAIQEFLVYFAFVMLLSWYLTFLWNRRKLYIFSRKVPGSFALPFIGSLHLFINDLSPNGILRTCEKYLNRYPGLCKLWAGTHLVYILTEPKHIQKVLTNKNALHKNFFYEKISDIIGTGIFTAPVLKWKRHRKIIETTTFNQKHLNSYVNCFIEQANIFSDQLTQYVGKDIDTYLLVSRLTVDSACQNVMGYKMDAQTTNLGFTKVINRIIEIIGQRIASTLLIPKSIFKLSALGKELDELVKEEEKVLTSMIETKKREHEVKRTRTAAEVEEDFNGKRKPFLELAVENSYFTDEDLRDELEVLLVGAYDTIAITFTFLFELLGLYQDVQQKVYEEVIEVLGEVRDAEASDLHQLKYTERVIKESLRLFPPAPVFFRHIGEDIDLGDAILPKGASVAVFPIYVHRIESLWPDPLKFDPDRFLSDRVQKRHPCAYIPFSYGPRNCIGAQYAMMNMKIIISTVIRKFIFFTAHKSIEDIKINLSVFLRKEGGSKISVALR